MEYEVGKFLEQLNTKLDYILQLLVPQEDDVAKQPPVSPKDVQQAIPARAQQVVQPEELRQEQEKEELELATPPPAPKKEALQNLRKGVRNRWQ